MRPSTLLEFGPVLFQHETLILMRFIEIAFRVYSTSIFFYGLASLVISVDVEIYLLYLPVEMAYITMHKALILDAYRYHVRHVSSYLFL